MGPMAYLEGKPEGDHSMPLKRRTGRGVLGVASRDPRDMAKAGLLEVQSPAMKVRIHRKTAPETGATPCPRLEPDAGAASAVVEHRPMRTGEGMSGRPTSRWHVQRGRTTGSPTGRES
jgi:hypothetical protein